MRTIIYLSLINVFLANSSCKKNDLIFKNHFTEEFLSAKSGDGTTKNIRKGLIAYFPFNGSANDLSTTENNGSVYGASLANDRHGKKNAAYSFDGIDDYIVIPSNSRYVNTDMTISYWKKTGIWRQDTDLMYGNNNEFSWQTGWNYNNNIGMQIMCYGGYGGSSSQAILDTNWNNLTFVISGNSLNVYINGIHNNILNNHTSIDCSKDSYNLYIGNDIYSFPEFYQYTIDDLRIYNRALNQSEIIYLATH